jgi:protein ImuA
LFRPRQAAHNHSPASLRLEMNAYRQVHILKQRGGNQYVDVRLGEENDIPGQPQLWELPGYPPAQDAVIPALGA